MSDLSVDRDGAEAQREARGGGGYRRPGEMNGVLVERIENCSVVAAVAHVHDAKRRLHTGGEDKKTHLRCTRRQTEGRAASLVAASLVTVREVQEMDGGEEGVIEDAAGSDPVLSVDQQHALQQRHKLPPVGLLCLHVGGIRSQHHVHLMGQREA